MTKDLKRQLSGLFSDAQELAEQKQAKQETPRPSRQPQPPAENEVLFQSLIDDLPVGYHEIDAEGRITRVNRTELAMLGYTAEEMLGRPTWEFIVDGEASRQTIQAKLTGQVPLKSVEGACLHKDGRHVPVLIQDRHILNLNGKIVGMRTTVEDITEHKQAGEAMRASEEKYRAILENIQEGYFEVDLAGNFTLFNDALARILGYPQDELMGMNNREYMDEENARAVYQAFNAIYRTHRPSQSVRYEILRRDGTRTSVEVSASLITDLAGELIGFRGIMRDITEHKQAEETLERRAMQLQTAAEVSRAATSILEMGELLPQVVELVRDHFGLYYVGLFLADETGDWAVLHAGTGEPGHQMLQAGHKLQIGGSSMIGWCVAHGQARIALDVGEEAVHFSNPLLPDTRSEMALPLISRGRVIGAMTIQSEQPAAFTQEDLTVLQTMADQLANAIENARLFEDTKSRLAQLTALQETTRAVASTLELDKLLNLIIQQATTLLQSTGGIINLVDWEKKEDEVVAAGGSCAHTVGFRSPLKNSLSGWVTLHNQPVISNQLQDDDRVDVHVRSGEIRDRNAAIAPLVVKDQVIGTLVAMNKQGGKGAFNQADLDLLVAFASQAAVAIQNARLFTETKRAEEAMRISEERFALAVRGTNDGLWDWDIKGQSLYWSPRLKELLGYADDELTVDFETFNRLLHPDDQERVTAVLEAHLKDRKPYDVEERQLHKSGEYRWLRARGQALWDENGNPVRMVGFSTDITERKEAEAERERLLADLEHRALQLQTGAEVSHAASSLLDPEELISQTVELICERFKLYYVGLFLVDETRRSAVLRGGTGEAGHQLLQAGHKLEVGGSSMIGWCVAHGQARIALDVGEEAVHFSNPLLPDTRSEMALPLISRGRVIGAMTIQSEQPAAFSQEDVAILQTMADQLATAIENARLLEEARVRAEEMAALNELSRALSTRLDLNQVLDEAYRGASRLMDTTNFYIALYDAPQNEVVFALDVRGQDVRRMAGRRQAGQGMTEHVIRSRAPLLLEENVLARLQELGVESIGPEAQSWLGVPMLLGDQAIGVIAVQSYTTPRAYNDHHRDLLDAIASQAAIAIQNARLFEETHRRAEEMAALNDLSRALSSRLELSQVLDEVYRGASRLMDTTNFFVALYDPQLDEVSFPLYAEGERVRPLAGRRRSGKGLTEHIIHSRAPLLIPENISARLQELGIESIGQEAQSWLGVPMLLGEQVLGVLAVQSYTTPRVYNGYHRDLLSAIASQTAIAIQNARLFEEARTRAEEMAALNDLSRVLSARLELSQVLDGVYRGISRLLDTTNFYIALYDPDRHEVSFPINVSESVLDQQITVMPADQGLTGYILRTRESLLIQENVGEWLEKNGMERVGEPAQSWLGVPMMLGDHMLGVMAVQDYKRPNLYDEHDRDMLAAIASQTAIAIQNARLFGETQAALAEAQALYETSRRIEAAQDPQEMVTAFADGLRVPGITWATLLMYERDEGGEIQAVQVQGNWYDRQDIAPMPIGTRFSKDMFAAMGVMLSTTPAFMDDTQDDPRFAATTADTLRQRNIRTAGMLPLTARGTQFGVLMLAGKAPHRFTEREVRACSTLVGQMAVIMENRRLLRETEARARREQLLREITSRVRGSTDAETIVRTAVRELGLALGRPAFIRLGSAEQLARAPATPSADGNGAEPLAPDVSDGNGQRR